MDISKHATESLTFVIIFTFSIYNNIHADASLS